MEVVLSRDDVTPRSHMAPAERPVGWATVNAQVGQDYGMAADHRAETLPALFMLAAEAQAAGCFNCETTHCPKGHGGTRRLPTTKSQDVPAWEL